MQVAESCTTFLMLYNFHSIKAVLKVTSGIKTEMAINLLKDFCDASAKRINFIRSDLNVLLTFSGY